MIVELIFIILYFRLVNNDIRYKNIFKNLINLLNFYIR